MAQKTEVYQFMSLYMGEFLELPDENEFSHPFYHHVLDIAWRNELIESLPIAVTEAGLELPNNQLPGLLKFLIEIDTENAMDDEDYTPLVDYQVEPSSLVFHENGTVQATIYTLDDFRYDLSEEDTMPTRIAEEITTELCSLFNSYTFDENYPLIRSGVSVIEILDCVFATRQEATQNRQTETLF